MPGDSQSSSTPDCGTCRGGTPNQSQDSCICNANATSQDDGSCTCNSGFYLSGSQCLPCSADSKVVALDGTCQSCPNLSSFSASTNACQCVTNSERAQGDATTSCACSSGYQDNGAGNCATCSSLGLLNIDGKCTSCGDSSYQGYLSPQTQTCTCFSG